MDVRFDLMARSSLIDLKQPAFAVISAVQDQRQSLALDAVALALTIMAQSAGIDPHELISRAKRQVADGEAVRNPHFEAIRDTIGDMQ